jgi:hypothetical protein
LEQELITGHQANLLMVAVLIAAPLIGLAWGAPARRVARGLTVGILIGVGNFVLWTVYNRITDRLGLDTVKNLLVNLALFAAVGIAVGLGAARWGAGAEKGNQ